MYDSQELCVLYEMIQAERADPNGAASVVYPCTVECSVSEARQFNTGSMEFLNMKLQIDDETGNDKGMEGCAALIDCGDDVGNALAYVDELIEKELLPTLTRTLRGVYVSYDGEIYLLNNVRALYVDNDDGTKRKKYTEVVAQALAEAVTSATSEDAGAGTGTDADAGAGSTC